MVTEQQAAQSRSSAPGDKQQNTKPGVDLSMQAAEDQNQASTKGPETLENTCVYSTNDKVEEKKPFEAKKIKSFYDFINTTKQLPRILQLVWSADPGLASFYLVMQILSGLTWVASFWIIKTLVDAIPAIAELHRVSSGSFSVSQLPADVILAFAVLAISWFFQQVSQPITDYCRRHMSDRLKGKIDLMIMDKANSAVDIAVLENPKFYDKLEHLRNDGNYRPIELLLTTARLIQVGITFLSLSIMLASLNFILLIAIVFFATPKIVIHVKHIYEYWAILLGEVPEVRKMRYYMRVLTNNLDGKEVRLFGLGQYFKDRYQHVFEQFLDGRSKIQRKHLFRQSSLAILSATGTICSYAYTVYEAVLGRISIGSLAMYMGAIGQIEYQLGEFAFLLAELYRHALYVVELFEFMEIEPAIKALKTGNSIPLKLPLQTGIEFRNVSFKYPDSDRLILDSVSFTIEPQQTVALVGENGAGKTTIVKLLSRLYEPSSGEILIDGIDITKIDPAVWRLQMAVVFQDYCRFQLNVHENIGIGNLKELNNKEAVKAAAELGGAAPVVAKLPRGYDTILGKAFENDAVGVELSGGEWQKIALSRAFMRSAKNGANSSNISGRAQLLILDEPTASLDVQSEADVYSKFHDLTTDTMALLITHRFSTVRIADKILVLEHGKIIEEGSHEKLISSAGSYSQLYNLQAERYK